MQRLVDDVLSAIVEARQRAQAMASQVPASAAVPAAESSGAAHDTAISEMKRLNDIIVDLQARHEQAAAKVRSERR